MRKPRATQSGQACSSSPDILARIGFTAVKDALKTAGRRVLTDEDMKLLRCKEEEFADRQAAAGQTVTADVIVVIVGFDKIRYVNDTGSNHGLTLGHVDVAAGATNLDGPSHPNAVTYQHTIAGSYRALIVLVIHEMMHAVSGEEDGVRCTKEAHTQGDARWAHTGALASARDTSCRYPYYNHHHDWFRQVTTTKMNDAYANCVAAN